MSCKRLKELVRGAGFETTQAKIANEAEEPDVIDISKLKKIGVKFAFPKSPAFALQIPQKPERFRFVFHARNRSADEGQGRGERFGLSCCLAQLEVKKNPNV
jgi:hypothetical protein